MGGTGEPAPEDAALRDDIRLLGGVLGDVIAEQHGPDVLAAVEQVRRLAVGVHRGGGRRDDLIGLLDECSIHDALTVIRAFSYFALLANIAEDVDQDRRRRRERTAGAPPRSGSLA